LRQSRRERIIEYAKRRKVFRASDVEHEFGLSRMYIWRLVQEGQLERARPLDFGFWILDFGLSSMKSAFRNPKLSRVSVFPNNPKSKI